MTSGPRGETESELPEIPAWVNETPEAPAAGPYDTAAGATAPEGAASGHAATQPAAAEPAAPGGARRRVIHRDDLEDLRVGSPTRSPRRRREGHWGRRILVGLGLLLATGVIVAVAAVVWVNGHLSGAGADPVTVSIPDQTGHAALTRQLTQAGVVSDGWLFQRYLDYEGVPSVAAGDYVFHHHEGYRQALHDLHGGPKISQVKLTIPEGYDLSQIAAAVGKLPGRSADRFLQLAQTGAVRSRYQPTGVNSLEGLVFPDTYFVTPAEDEQAILQHMVDRFDEVASAAGLDNSAATNGLSPYQTIVVASLIEKEAKIDEDRAMIARVIVNRLAKGMKLQIDATVLYAEGVHKSRVLNSDLQTNSPYNTYKVTGLPPGPIAAPGKPSLAAALNPTAGTWLYYVLIDPSGKHGFATTNAEFNTLRAEAKAKGLL
ncbi:MAG: hypothetical protein NVSMB12_16210 [Acidimicrobiales bacterium]